MLVSSIQRDLASPVGLSGVSTQQISIPSNSSSKSTTLMSLSRP